MRFWTIWTLPAATVGEKLNRTREWAWRCVAHRLPRRVAYWSYIDSTVRHTHDDEVVPAVLATDILRRMDR